MKKYDKQAAEFIERSYQTPEIINQRLRTMAALDLKPGESVLDAGCGTGLLLELEAKAVGSQGRAEGVDYSADMLAVARKRCAPQKQVNLHQASIETLDFTDASFDALSCTQTLLYVDDLNGAMRDFYRVLKPGGRIAIIETDWDGAVINSRHREITRKIFDACDNALVNPNLPRTLRPLLANFGFNTIQVEAIPILNAGHGENSFSFGMLENFAKSACKQNIISEPESKIWTADIEELAQRDQYFFCVNRFLFTALK